MAKYDVSHSCGHVVTHQLFGKNAERERKIRWLETTDCDDCRKQAFNEAKAAEAAEIAASGATEGLPALQGSEKQVAWAETIRVEVMRRIGDGLKAAWERQRAAADANNPQADEMGDALVSVEGEWARHLETASAKWWIDRGQDLSLNGMRSEYLERQKDEEEKRLKDAQQARQLADAEAEQRRLWDLKAESIRVVREALGDTPESPVKDPYRINVWNKTGKEVRVYIDFDLRDKIACYYETGNDRCAPGTLEVQAGWAKGRAAEIKAACEWLCARWKVVQIDVPILKGK